MYQVMVCVCVLDFHPSGSWHIPGHSDRVYMSLGKSWVIHTVTVHLSSERTLLIGPLVLLPGRGLLLLSLTCGQKESNAISEQHPIDYFSKMMFNKIVGSVMTTPRFKSLISFHASGTESIY